MDDECVEELGKPISSLKVAELRDELTKRSLTRTGNKKELIDRLRLAIQRQSSTQHQPSQYVAIDQSNLQQQQLQQNVPQLINAAAVIQQNQVAYQNQLNQQIQTQPQLATAAYTMPANQQYQQTLIQPLGLQQQLSDHQNQVQFVQTDYQQQQQIIVPEVQKQDSIPQVPPAIDMRVSQQAQDHQIQSIDLSNNAKQQQTIACVNIEPTVDDRAIVQELREEQSQQEELIKEPTNIEQGKRIEHQEEILASSIGQESSQNPSEVSSQKETIAQDTMIESDLKSKTNQHQAEVAPVDQADDKINTESPQLEAASVNDLTELQNEKSSQSGQNTTVNDESIQSQEADKSVDESAKTEKSNVLLDTSRSSISLKRGGSDLKSNSGGREKRRKWSSKVSQDSDETNFGGDSAQGGIMSGGISSQKLQELIVEKQLDSTMNTNDSSINKDTEKGTVNELKENQGSVSSAVTATVLKTGENIIQEKQTKKDSKKNKPSELKESYQSIEPEKEIEPTNILLVQNLVRPFTLSQLKEVLTKHGPINEEKFWTDKVKSKCCVMYDDIEVAKLAKDSLHGQQWPSSNPKTLKVTYITEETLLSYQESEKAKALNETAANGGNTAAQAGKLNTTRAGQKSGESGDASDDDQTKKRLGNVGEVSTKSSNVNRGGDKSQPQELDDLFKKTKAVPHLFWLPLTESQADVRKKERDEREIRAQELRMRRSPPRRRSPARHRTPPRHRSPRGRRSSPPSRDRSRSPVNRRSAPRQRPPLIRRPSPMRRRSPVGRNSPPRRRSPIQMRRSPPSYRSPARRSPPSHGRSPRLLRRSRSRSPIRSPRLNRRSPIPSRRSPMTMRRSPQLIRRSPAPIRGLSPLPLERNASPPRRRSPPRRLLRSPPRQISPDRAMSGYSAEQRRPQRLDRLR